MSSLSPQLTHEPHRLGGEGKEIWFIFIQTETETQAECLYITDSSHQITAVCEFREARFEGYDSERYPDSIHLPQKFPSRSDRREKV